MKRTRTIHPLWLWGILGLSVCEVLWTDGWIIRGPLRGALPFGWFLAGAAWHLVVIGFSFFAHRRLYAEGEWFVKAPAVTLNPGAERWFLPLYLFLWAFSAAAAGFAWRYGARGAVVFPAVQLGMILWARKRLVSGQETD